LSSTVESARVGGRLATQFKPFPDRHLNDSSFPNRSFANHIATRQLGALTSAIADRLSIA